MLIKQFIQCANIVSTLNLISCTAIAGASWSRTCLRTSRSGETLLLHESLSIKRSYTSLHLDLEVVNLWAKFFKNDAICLHLIIEVLSRFNQLLLELWLLLDDYSWSLFPHVEEVVPEHLEFSLESLVVFPHLTDLLFEKFNIALRDLL